MNRIVVAPSPRPYAQYHSVVLALAIVLITAVVPSNQAQQTVN
jgi:hypothetical protein